MASAASDVRAVVMGGRGMLGVDLVAALRYSGFGRVQAADLPEVDITDDDLLRGFFAKIKPAVIFNCAALTDVDGCESNWDGALAVNAEGAGRLARLAASLGARLIHVSTDYVFDGQKSSPYGEEDPPAPLSAYGKSKLEGERLVAAAGGKWVIARTAWLYGRAGKNFIDRMLELATQGDEVSVVTDRVGSPTWTRDLAEALVAMARHDAQGLFHVANDGACSRYEMVRFLADCLRLPVNVQPVGSSAFPRPAVIPAYCALSTEKLRREVGHVMRPWQDALREYVQSRVSPEGRQPEMDNGKHSV